MFVAAFPNWLTTSAMNNRRQWAILMMEYAFIPARNTLDPAGVSSERMFVYLLSVQREGLKVKGKTDFNKELWSKSWGSFDKEGLKHFSLPDLRILSRRTERFHVNWEVKCKTCLKNPPKKEMCSDEKQHTPKMGKPPSYQMQI